MRIISSFKDFYDSVQRTGMDKDVIYVRETSEILIKDEFQTIDMRSSSDCISTYFLGFCGYIYRIYKITESNGAEHIYYDYEDFKKQSIDMKILKEYDFDVRWWPTKYNKFKNSNVKNMLTFFHKYNTPLFLIKHSDKKNKETLVLNPVLRAHNFQTIKDTYTTYQDIFQYVSGVLNSKENNTSEVSNQTKIDKHGFDKWSFRKMPTKKK